LRKADLLAALAPFLVAGCATSALHMAPPRYDRPWQPQTTEAGEIIPGELPAENPSGPYVLPSNPAVGIVPPGPGVNATQAYTLPQLIDIAESTNPDTRVAWDEARNAALRAGIAEAAYLPNVTASVIAGYQVFHGQAGSPALEVNGNNANGVISALSAQWLLFDFGQRSAVVEAAKQMSVISNIQFTAAHQQVIYNVSVAFYTNVAARARVQNADRSLKDAQDVEAAAQARFKHGIGTVVEAAQARQATAQARLAKVQADGAAQNTYVALLAAIGISPLTPIKIADISNRKLSYALTGSADRIVSEALARRPDMLSAYAAQRASAANVEAAEAEFLPKLFVAATGTYATGGGLTVTAIPGVGQSPATQNVTNHELGAIIIAGVTVPIYDAGVRDAALAQAKSNADRADAIFRRAREDAVREIVTAQNSLRTSLSAYDAARTLEAAAQTTFDAATASYRHGIGSITDATSAETGLLTARNAAADAYSTALSTAATLALATGSLGAAPE
jgi:outer membrane protein